VDARRGARRVTLAEAGELLDISKGAVRQRVRRGTLRSEKGDDGRVYVYVDTSADDVQHSARHERDELVQALRDQVEDLRRERDEWREQARMTDRLLSAAMERIPPQLEAPQEATEAAEAAEEALDRAGPTPLREELGRAPGGRGGEGYSEGRRSMHNDQAAQDATRLLVAFSTNHPEARLVSPHGLDRPFTPNWADAEQAGLNRVRRDTAMEWLVHNDMLERDEEAEKLLGAGKGFYSEYGSVFRITDPGRELLEEARERRPE
jgi:hypothetical protein